MKKIIAFFAGVLLLTLTLQSLIVMNDIVPAFAPGEREKIEGAIIQGGIHFLQAKSQADLLLKEYELSSRQAFNFVAALEYLDNAAGELEAAGKEYSQAIVLGQSAGYVPEQIQAFKKFDYESVEGLGEPRDDIMNRVREYLSQGDIMGAYRENASRIDKILINLGRIKEKLQTGAIPDISLFWSLLQQFCETALFGNYCTVTAQAVFSN